MIKSVRSSSITDPQDEDDLLVIVDTEIQRLRASLDESSALMKQIDREEAALGYHPNYPAYVHGGLFAAVDMNLTHALALAGFYLLHWEDALTALHATQSGEEKDLLLRLRALCESDAALEAAGHAWLVGPNQKHGGLPSFWKKRHKFALGQAALRHGLTAEQRYGHRGLYTLSIATLHRGFAKAAAIASSSSFGALVGMVIDMGGQPLAQRGAQAIHAGAKARYLADCASFAAHQRRTGDRRWRWKLPLARQGHLAATTARQLGIAMPAERTRGHAAAWLESHDANLRFRED